MTLDWPDLRWERPWAVLLASLPVIWILLELRRFVPLPVRVVGPKRSPWYVFAAAFVLIVGIAGPRWGRSDRDGVAIGRDVMIVLDLSRSMQATDLATPEPRWKAATMAARDLVTAAAERGGHRIGVVVFAAKPMVLVPLTTDYEHVLQRLDELDGSARPQEIRPDDTSLSGTRIGAALRHTIQNLDERYPGRADLMLLSDGDDPAEDQEWRLGIAAARAAQVPVHCVGIGGLDEAILTLKKRNDPDGDQIQTALREEVLRAIANETGGEYLAARRDPPRLGEFFRRSLESQPSREFADDAVALRRNRGGWFYALALVLILVGWWRS